MCDVFMVNAEKGETTIEETDRIRNKDALFQARCDDIHQVARMKDWLIAHTTFRDANDEERLKKIERSIGYINDGPAKRFNTVIVDSITEIQAFSNYQALGTSSAQALDTDIAETNWGIFGKVLTRSELMARAFRDLPMHVIMLCQEKWHQDEQKRMHYQPAMMGQMAKSIQGFFDIVGFLQRVPSPDATKDDLHRLWVQPVGKFAAKNRRSSFKEDYFDNPTLSDIFKGIRVSTQKA